MSYASVHDPRLRPPRLLAQTVRRERLLDRLDRLAPLAVVDGPPGCGATTLLADWAEHQELRGSLVLWVDPLRMAADEGLTGVVAAWLARAVGVGEHGIRDVAAAQVAQLAAATGRRCIVVVDDADTWLEDVAVLLDALAMTRHLHLVVVARGAETLVERAERARLEVLLLTGDQLAAGVEELAAMARCWGHSPTGPVLDRVREAVGGWLLPARLALDATSEGSDALVLDQAADVVHRCLTAAAPPGTIQMEVLSAAALVSRVDASALRQVARELGLPLRPGWSTVVQQLTRRSLLVRSRDGDDGWWSVPRLVRRCVGEVGVSPRVRELVASTLRSDPALSLPADLGRMALHARLSQDWVMLRDLWTSRGLELVAEHAEAAAQAYDRMPAEVTERMPALRIAATVTGGGIDSVDGRALRGRYVQAGLDIGPKELAASHPDDLAAAVSATLVARRRGRDLEGALDIAQWYTARTARAGSREKAAPSPQAWFELERGRTLLLAGDLRASLAASERAVSLGAGRADCHPQVRSAAGQAALAASLLASPHETRQWLDIARRAPEPPGWIGAWVSRAGHVAQAMLALDALDEAAVDEVAPSLRAVPVTSELWPCVVMATARHATIFGDPDAEILWLYDGLTRRGAINGPSADDEYLIERCRLRLLLATGELTRVRTQLESGRYPRTRFPTIDAHLQLVTGSEQRSRAIAEAAARAPGTPARDRGELLLLHAAAALRCGRVEEARRVLASAHANIQRLGVLSAYVTVPREDVEALLNLQVDPPPAAVMARELMRAGHGKDAAMVVLTPRELEVLRQSARHGSLAAVASALSVSVNTIKKQRVSLYAKLGVNDLQDAVLRARQLGLITT